MQGDSHVILETADGLSYASLRRRSVPRTDRYAIGQSLREKVPRSALGDWSPAPDRRDPVEQIVETVLQEDADAVGLSILSGAHMTLVPRVVELLREQDAGDVVVTVGGTIPNQDIPELKKLGVAEVFTPGAPTQDIIDFIRGAVTP